MLATTPRDGRVLLTTPFSPQTLKIIRTAELSPFIVFIAPTDKAEQVGGRVLRLSPPPAGLACPQQWGKEPAAATQGCSSCSTSASSCLH